MIVETYYIRGIKVNIDDGAYAGKSAEELERIRENAEGAARDILLAVQRRAAEKSDHEKQNHDGAYFFLRYRRLPQWLRQCI